MNNQTRKFFIYTRKSTDTEDRQVRSISDQLAELKELAVKEQIEVVDIFVEKQTAKAPGRPVFNEMLLRIEANEANGILAWHPDRLARNSVDGGKIIEQGSHKELLAKENSLYKKLWELQAGGFLKSEDEEETTDEDEEPARKAG